MKTIKKYLVMGIKKQWILCQYCIDPKVKKGLKPVLTEQKCFLCLDTERRG